MANFLDLFAQPVWATRMETKLDALMADTQRIEDKLETIFSLLKKVDETVSNTWEQVKQETVDFITSLQGENEQLRTALSDAQTKAQENADALQKFQDDDAATDAQQLADQAQAFADDLKATVDALKPVPTPPVLPDEPPVEDPPVE